MEVYLDGQWAPQLIKHQIVQKSGISPFTVYPVDIILRDVDWVHWMLTPRSTGHDVDRVHMDLKPNSWGVVSLVLIIHSVPGRHHGHDVDRVHMDS